MPKIRKKEHSGALVPMIDIVFILLIFFVLTLSLAPKSVIAPRAASGGFETSASPDIFLIELGPVGEVRLEGVQIDLLSLVTKLEADPETPMAVRPDAGVSFGALVSFLEAVDPAQIHPVIFVTRS